MTATMSMKFLLRSMAVALMLAATTAPAPAQTSSDPIPLDRIVAVVNDDVILASELNDFVRTIRAQLRRQNTSPPPRNVLEKQALDRLIMQRIQVQRAEQTGIRVDDETLNQAVRNIAQRNNLTLDQFRRALEADGFNYAKFREDIRHEIMISRLQQRNVDNRIQVSEQEVENFLAERGNLGREDVLYKLSHILIAVPDGASPEQIQQARQKAEQVRADLRSGADFSQTAVSVSDGQQALEGGELGWFSAGQVPRIFSNSVVQMEPGQISELIRSPSGFHIVRLDGTKGQSQHMVQQTKVRHILIKTNEVVSNQQARARLQQLRARILAGEDFGEMARSHSDDTLSARDGGSLGWVSKGETVPRFQEAVQGLQTGELSEPVQTRFGWHLIQVMDRRKQDDTEEFQRAKATELIRKRKRQEALELWLRRLRDEAYVEYRLETTRG